MRNGILRDVIFAGAGVFVVLAVIGLPGQAAAGHQQWRVDQSQCQVLTSPSQGAQLMPCYMPRQPPPVPAPAIRKAPRPTP
jgi:hypothetical protein